MLDVGLLTNLVTTVAVIVGVAFGIVQLRHLRQERRDLVAIEVVHTLQNWAAVEAAHRIWMLAPGVRARDIASDKAIERDVVLVCNAYDSFGYLLHRGVVPIEQVDEQIGPFALVLWSRCERWVRASRTTSGTDDLYRWFEYLAGEIGKRRGPEAVARIMNAGAPTSPATTPRP